MTKRLERYQKIVEAFEDTARASPGQSLGIAALSRIVGIAPRTLARAVRALHDTTPSRYLRTVRLALARQALLRPGAGTKTVTAVATQFGFSELGRFAGEYRRAFGESPSETLRRSVIGQSSD